MKEIVIISGKGGTGKTSIAASFAALANGNAVMADCDVDAADLHLILKPEIVIRSEFRSGHKAAIRPQDCTGCGKCAEICRFGAVVNNNSGGGEVAPYTPTWKMHDSKPSLTPTPLQTWRGVQKLPNTFSIDPVGCEGCGVCVQFCPAQAINFAEEVCGEWFVSDTRFGTMVHARIGIAAENSGKLVTLVRNEAKRLAKNQAAEFVLIDGSPGIGCPVIASLTAADLALIVTEPTVSGDHDLRRIAGLTKQLQVPAMVCVNKWDINASTTGKIKDFAHSQGIGFAGIVRYDKAVTQAQRKQEAVTEFCSEGVAIDIQNIWGSVTQAIIE